MRGHWMIAPLLALSASAPALQEIEVADGRTVTVKVSSRELTRVSMAGERRIVRVWGLEERMTVEPDKDGGQVFVRPAQVPSPRPFSFFVKDDSGATYTLVAVPVDMPSDAIVLSAARPPRDERGVAQPYIGVLKTLARAMMDGSEADGYTSVAVGRERPFWR